jgi:DNA polymerase II small subunit
MREKLLNFCKDEGILLDKELIDIFSMDDYYLFGLDFFKKIKINLNKKFITKEYILKNIDILDSFSFSSKYDDFKREFGLYENNLDLENNKGKVSIKNLCCDKGKTLEVDDFVKYFKKRYEMFVDIFQNENFLCDLNSISKVKGNKKYVTIVGMVSSKFFTKNKNLILEVEDLFDSCRIVVSFSNKDIYEEAENLPLDSVLVFNGTFSNDVLFLNKIIYPKSELNERKKSNFDENVLFLGDIHFGSKNFMKENFEKFVDYLNSDLDEIKKIKYIFIVGDLIAGVGNYPNQDRDLEIIDLKKQFDEFSNLLKKINKNISIIISPGNHDCVRLMEPQPLLDRKFANSLYEMENVIMIENPSFVNIGKNVNFSGFDVLVYHGFSFPYYANNIPELVKDKCINDPVKIMKYLLKFRHLAPDNLSDQYFPGSDDFLLIKNIPDIFVAGHLHRSGIVYKDNVLLISTSTWERKTSYQEKLGNDPDYCKVPMVNLKTRAVKILDFENLEDEI